MRGSRVNKDELIRKISKKMFLREDVVEDVVNEFLDHLIAETVRTGGLLLTDFISIRSHEWGSYKLANRETPIPPHHRLKVKISKNLRDLHKFFGPNSEYPGIITTDNWRELLKLTKTAKKGEAPDISRLSPPKREERRVQEQDFSNPFLDD